MTALAWNAREGEARKNSRAVLSKVSGYVSEVDARALGQVVVDLGGGRTRPDQALDHAVGLAGVASRGDAIETGQPLAIIHARSVDQAAAMAARVLCAFRIGVQPPPVVSLFRWHVPEVLAS